MIEIIISGYPSGTLPQDVKNLMVEKGFFLDQAEQLEKNKVRMVFEKIRRDKNEKII